MSRVQQAHLLWAYYHAIKKRNVVPVQPAKKKPLSKKAKMKKSKRKIGNG